MNAQEARQLALNHVSHLEEGRDLDRRLTEAGVNPVEILTEGMWGYLMELVRERALEGKMSLQVEPFSMIPAKYHPEDRETAVMMKITERLREQGYQNVTWDRRDQRVVLRLEWRMPVGNFPTT